MLLDRASEREMNVRRHGFRAGGWKWMGLWAALFLLLGCKPEKKSLEELEPLRLVPLSQRPASSRRLPSLLSSPEAQGASSQTPTYRSKPVPGQKTFDYGTGLQGWKGYGTCEGKRESRIGHHGKGSLWLSCFDNRQSYTFYRTLQNLKPGQYKVTSWLRGLDVKKGQWDVSVWVFSDGGEGLRSPIKNLKGTFSWSRLTYTINVKGNSLTLWFRLKSQGQLWVDDVVVAPYSGAAISGKLERSPNKLPEAGGRGVGKRCKRCYRWWPPQHRHCSVCGGATHEPHPHTMFAPRQRQAVKQSKSPSRPKVRVLLDFEATEKSREERHHPFRNYRSKATSGRRAAVMVYGRYNNMTLSDRGFSNWSGYRYIAMDVFNPMQKHVAFHLCVNDKPINSYWNQLNHIVRLAPGWNRLRFSLRRYVGERGSVRIRRRINLARIRRFWFAVGAEKPERRDPAFLVDHIRLEQGEPPPKAFADLYRFDFVTQRDRTQSGFVGITTQHLYKPSVGFGFQKMKVWRRIDSKYADTLLRDAILTPEGSFRVDVPNGTYDVWLFARHLGMWYEHFWKRRKIWINGRLWHNTHRHHARHYLKDFLRLQDIVPTPKDEAYDLYLRKLLAPFRTKVTVTNGALVIRWRGDGPAIALNALLLYPRSKRKQGLAFVRQLRRQQRNEFRQISRKLAPLAKVERGAIKRADRRRGFYAPLIEPSSYVRYNWVLRSRGRKIALEGGWGQRPMQALMVRNFQSKARLQIKVSSLRSRRGAVIPASSVMVRYGVEQFVGHEINHETYELAPRFLRDFPEKGLSLHPNHSLLVWMHIPLQRSSMKAGTYRGTLQVKMHGKTIRYPIRLKIHPFSLPKLDIPVGYFGLDPVSFEYFKGEGVREVKRKWRKKVLEHLSERGFSTWTSLPSAQIRNQGGRIKVNTDEVSWLLKLASRLGFEQPVFTYGGGFVDNLLQIDNSEYILDLPHHKYRKQSARILREFLKRHSIPIVYNFSDEATGYSQKVERDAKRAKRLKQWYPFLRRGGFSHSLKPGHKGEELNLSMTDISLSSVKKYHAQTLQERGLRWGFYNAAIGPFEVGRATFGEGLFSARWHGASHRLAWHLTLTQNYPYYDLDGRESDAMMLFPRMDGSLEVALKMEWATQGLEDYRLLLLLEKLAKKAGRRGRSARTWLARNYREVNFFGSPNYLQLAEQRRTDAKSRRFRAKVYRQILRLLR